MAIWMATHKDPAFFAGKRVMEIGAGLAPGETVILLTLSLYHY